MLNFASSELLKIYNWLYDADKALKSLNVKDHIIIEDLLIKICT